MPCPCSIPADGFEIYTSKKAGVVNQHRIIGLKTSTVVTITARCGYDWQVELLGCLRVYEWDIVQTRVFVVDVSRLSVFFCFCRW